MAPRADDLQAPNECEGNTLGRLDLKSHAWDFDKVTVPKKYTCRNNSNVNGQCMISHQYNAYHFIYKVTVTKDGKYYIGKTQNDMITRFFKHITDVGKFWSKRKQLNQSVGLKLVCAIDDTRLIASVPAANNNQGDTLIIPLLFKENESISPSPKPNPMKC